MDYKLVDPRALKIDQRELSSRLSIPMGEGADFSGVYEKLMKEAKPSYVATRVKLNVGNGGISIGSVTTRSLALAKIAEGCSEAIVFVATLGVGVDRLILRTAHQSGADAFILDAMADALVESLCDLAENTLSEGLDTVGRFSPGYADLELSVGYEILNLCSAEKLLGIKVSESGLMIPKKSVNAIIMVKD